MSLPLPPAEPPIPASAASQSPKRWHVGTLTYTAGGIAALFFWLLWGDFAWSLKDRSVQSTLQLLLKRYEASDFLNGVLIGTMPYVIAVILQPMISYRSDRHRGRWGRRLPYLVWTTLVTVLGMVGLAYSPELAGAVHGALGERSPGFNPIVLTLFTVFWAVFEFGTLAVQVLFQALINDVVPQSLLGRFFGLFRALSLIAGIFFNYVIFRLAEVHFKAIFLIIGLVYGLAFLFMCLKVKEGEYPPPPAEDETGGSSFLDTARTYLTECFSNPYYAGLFVGYNLCWVAQAPVNLFSVFYAKSLQMDMGRYGEIIALSYGLSLVLSFFLGMLADRFHPLRVGIVTTCLQMVLYFAGTFLIRDVDTFSIAFLGHTVLSGTFLTSTASLGQRLFPKARFAQFYSAMMLVYSIGMIVISPAMGQLLDLTGHSYRLTFLTSGTMELVGIVVLLWVHRRFVALGGPKNYRAPE